MGSEMEVVPYGAGAPPDGPSAGADEDDKPRWQISPAALLVLQHVFAMQPFPSKELRASLALKLNVNERQIQTW